MKINNTYKVAFFGNPNVGKSSLINALSKKHELNVGNWNGVTVEKQEVKIKNQGNTFILTDLPGINNFSGKTIEEKITVSNLLSSSYDLYVNVVDINNLQKSLNITLLFKELNLPFIVLLNFSDDIKEVTNAYNLEKLSKILSAPVLPVSAKKKNNIDETIELIIKNCLKKDLNAQNSNLTKNFFLYNQNLQNLYTNIYNNLRSQGFEFVFSVDGNDVSNKFAAIRLIEQDHHFEHHVKIENLNLNKIKKIIEDYQNNFNENSSISISFARKKFIQNAINSIQKVPKSDKRVLKTLKLDKVFLNEYVGLPIMLAIFLLSFILVFNISTPIKNWLDELINNFFAGFIYNSGWPKWLISLINDGILAGLGTIITFAPLVFVLFLWINILKETGYMSRISFILNRLFNSIGLSGKSLVPLVLGFGCNVSSIYATRTISSEKKRKATALIAPLMSCSARLPIYALFVATFFSQYAHLVIFSLYILGIVVAVILGLILKLCFKIKNNDESLEELPLYSLPNMNVAFKSSVINLKLFLKKASTLILSFSIIIWLLSYFPYGIDGTNYDRSILADFSKFISVIFIPIGFGHVWQFVASILPAIAAKEVTVAVIGITTSTSDPASFVNVGQLFSDLGSSFLIILEGFLPNHWFSTFSYSEYVSPKISQWLLTQEKTMPNINLYSISFMVFMLLTIPCITTLFAIKHEFGWKTTFLSIALGLLIPYIVCLIVYWISFAIANSDNKIESNFYEANSLFLNKVFC